MKISKRPELRTAVGRSGFTLIELLTVIAIIGILASILIPVVSKVRDSARNANCLSNVRQWAQAVILYAEDHNGFYAVRDDWQGSGVSSWNSTTSPYNDYLQLSEVVRDFRTCPMLRDYDVTSYAINWPSVNGASTPRDRIPYGSVRDTSNFLLFVDAEPGDASAMWVVGSQGIRSGAVIVQRLSEPDTRHGGNMNASFGDGHVRSVHWHDRSGSNTDRNSFVAQWNRWTEVNN